MIYLWIKVSGGRKGGLGEAENKFAFAVGLHYLCRTIFATFYRGER